MLRRPAACGELAGAYLGVEALAQVGAHPRADEPAAFGVNLFVPTDTHRGGRPAVERYAALLRPRPTRQG